MMLLTTPETAKPSTRNFDEDHDRSTHEPVVLRCSGTADLLAALPFLTGFTAQDSLFLVLFSGSRSGSVVRFDLPAENGPETLKMLDVVGQVMSETGFGSTRPAAIIQTSTTFTQAGGPPFRRFAKMLRRHFERQGWALREIAVVAPDGWAGLLEQPPIQRPLSEIEASPIRDRAREVTGDPRDIEELASLPEPDPKRAANILTKLAELDQRDAPWVDPSDTVDGLPAWLHGVARVAGACFEARSELPEPRLCARLISATEHPASWLVVLVAATVRPEFAIEAAADMDPVRLTQPPIDTEDGWSLRGLLAAFSKTPPDARKLEQTIAAASEIAAHAPHARRPGLLAFLAWAWWMLGLQSVALALIKDGTEIDGDYPIARMVAHLVETPPIWVVRGTLAPSGSDQR